MLQYVKGEMVGPGANGRQATLHRSDAQVKTGRADKDLRPQHRYNRGLPRPRVALGSIMEAEQLNAIANTLADLTDRTGQLRRYL
jgi:hypothetical protein